MAGKIQVFLELRGICPNEPSLFIKKDDSDDVQVIHLYIDFLKNINFRYFDFLFLKFPHLICKAMQNIQPAGAPSAFPGIPKSCMILPPEKLRKLLCSSSSRGTVTEEVNELYSEK